MVENRIVTTAIAIASIILHAFVFPVTAASAIVYCFVIEAIVFYWCFRAYLSLHEAKPGAVDVKAIQTQLDDLQSKMNAFTLRMGFHT